MDEGYPSTGGRAAAFTPDGLQEQPVKGLVADVVARAVQKSERLVDFEPAAIFPAAVCSIANRSKHLLIASSIETITNRGPALLI
jgi:hypothetical protein